MRRGSGERTIPTEPGEPPPSAAAARTGCRAGTLRACRRSSASVATTPPTPRRWAAPPTADGEPVVFLKPWHALVAMPAPVRLPPRRAEIHHEAEVVLRIGAGPRVEAIALGLDLTDRAPPGRRRRRPGSRGPRAKGFRDSAPWGRSCPPRRPVARRAPLRAPRERGRAPARRHRACSCARSRGCCASSTPGTACGRETSSTRARPRAWARSRGATSSSSRSRACPPRPPASSSASPAERSQRVKKSSNARRHEPDARWMRSRPIGLDRSAPRKGRSRNR